PDWLGEIFEWISCADEYSCCTRDYINRVPFANSYVGRHKLSPTKPFAAIAMRALQCALQRLLPGTGLVPRSPVREARHIIVNTHDVDFLPLGRVNTVRRLLKNAAISITRDGFSKSVAMQVAHAARVACGGKDPFDNIIDLAEAECSRGTH